MNRCTQSDYALCVDLDGTLIRSDISIEACLALIKQNPFAIFLMVVWIVQGRDRLKSEVASRVDLDLTHLPMNDSVIEFVQTQRDSGTKTYLVTASHEKYARDLNKSLELFDGVFGTTDALNLKGKVKAEFLVDEFGETAFDYIGDSKADEVVWAHSRKRYIVTDRPKQSLSASYDGVFSIEPPRISDCVKALRIHQWSKNVLIFLPYFLDHRFGDWSTLLTLILAFFAFNLLASATYIVNDLLDLSADRRSSSKWGRPIPAGKIPLDSAIVMACVLFLFTALLALTLPPIFNLCLLGYLVATLSYSLYLKSYAVLDVCTLASLYTIRIVAGTLVIDAEWSFWLLAFSVFFFMSLALAKRTSEMISLLESGNEKAEGRGYKSADLPMLISSGTANGYISVLVIALYVNSDKVSRMYEFGEVLWLICPLLLYWIGRVWMITNRGEMDKDPVVFALKDGVSQLVVLICGFIVCSAIFIPSLLK